MKSEIHTIKSNSTVIHLMGYDAFDPLSQLHYLTDGEKERFFQFKHIGRRREFVATRILRHQVFGFQHIEYDPFGAPYIRDTGFISISHSKNLVGLAINANYKIGLDLETPRDNILDIYPKFLSDDESKVFDTTSKSEMTKVWSSKEALYKLAGRKKIIFKRELLLGKGDSDNWTGQIVNHDHDLLVKLDIFDHYNTVVSINSQAVDRIDRNIQSNLKA
jgi:4'-phosphopantetheinyl transferase